MDEKPKVGLLGLMLELYQGPFPDLKESMARLAEAIAEELRPRLEVVFPGVCVRRDEVEAALGRFEEEGAHLVVVVCLTYAPSLVSAPALRRSSLPLVIFDTAKAAALGPEMTGEDLLENHGIHGVQDLANVLAREGHPFGLVVGHFRDPRAQEELVAWARAARVRAALRRLRVGLLGEPFEGMGDFAVEFDRLREELGPEVVPLEMGRLRALAEEVSTEEVSAAVAETRQRFEVEGSVSEEVLAASVRWALALQRLVEAEGLDAFSMNFLAFRPEVGAETVPFLGASELMARGVGYAGEGDVCCAALVAASGRLCGPAGFTEMFCPDFAGGQLLMSHMAECNLEMVRSDRPVRLAAKPFPWTEVTEPVVPVAVLAPGPATLASLTAWRDGGWRLVVTEGTVLDTPSHPHLVSPYFRFKPDRPLEEFLRDYSLAAGTHHLAVVFGRRAEHFRKLASLLGIECVVV